MNVYFQLLQDRSKTDRRYSSVYVFDTNFYTDLVTGGRDRAVRVWGLPKNIFDFRYLLWPVHTGPRLNGHWSLGTADTVNLVVQLHCQPRCAAPRQHWLLKRENNRLYPGRLYERGSPTPG